ncbi:MAG: sulfite exporter TauE/SafE family protein [Planctomycetes bacterium]|nr:sulfite exporter TauE/SafE family protein [Planctomycetota bacterium]
MLQTYLLIVFVAAVLQGLSGFGFGLVCMSVLPFFVPVRFAVVLISVLRAVPVATLLIQLRRHLEWRRIAPLLLGAVAGVPVGVWFLRTASPTAVRVALGVVLTSYALWALFRPTPAERPEPARGWGLLAGALGGVLGGGFNTGGPPVVLYAAVAGWQRDMLRASLSCYFSTVIVVQLSLFAGSGILTLDVLRVQLLAAPAVILGTWLGSKLASRVPQARFQRGLLVLILILGLTFLVRSLRGLIS